MGVQKYSNLSNPNLLFLPKTGPSGTGFGLGTEGGDEGEWKLPENCKKMSNIHASSEGAT